MPRGRLTHQDRRQIAAGLAGGLSYSEIAKGLERPTSTVTREVTRNGGPGGYRADGAQLATRRRARRGAALPAAPGSAGAPEPPDPAFPQELRAFQEQFIGFLVNGGLPRMPAGVLACLCTSDHGSLTAAELAERLKVSPATVSKAVGYLEGQELIRRRRDPRERRDTYVIDEDVWVRAMIAGARVDTVLAQVAREGAGILGVKSPVGRRLDGMGAFLDHVGQDLIRAAERWRHG
ncbi:GbsR/MarR family transcriptional regulator [Streptomyces sp. BE303]|uniref:GbsR/MarR family transcriptional regulator n=1 Tax=Streptomyces sp. BE303 TaxID=3002528 RepID=UPI002E76251B|nr:helix-turn-helix domain-containing protein [Streptomyces sp. BE303]MED7954503.1 helix-turn-helix domain-containing protein [Streptomyces sp. BE303]